MPVHNSFVLPADIPGDKAFNTAADDSSAELILAAADGVVWKTTEKHNNKQKQYLVQ